MDKKTKRKLVGVFIFALAVFSMFGLVSAARGSALYNSLQGNALFKPFIDLVGITSSEGFAGVLLCVLVILAVYSLMSFIPLFSSTGVKWVASVIVGVLAFLYVDASTIQTLLLSYEAVGFVFSGVMPFIIVITFVVKVETDKQYQGKNAIFGYLLSNGVLLAFLIYLGFRAFDMFFVSSGKWSEVNVIGFIVLLLAVCAFVLFKRRIITWLKDLDDDVEISNYRSRVRKADARTRIDAAAVSDQE